MSKYVYPAVFTPEDNGMYSVHFPDLESCYTQGDDLSDAYDMASDILCLCLYRLETSGMSAPQPSNVNDVPHDGNAFVSLVNADTITYRRQYENKAVKKTLTIPSWLNDMAEQHDINFSYTLQTALKSQLGIAE